MSVENVVFERRVCVSVGKVLMYTTVPMQGLGVYPQTRGFLYKDSYFCDIIMIMGSHEVKSTGSNVGR